MNLVFNKMRILPLVLICFSSISSADECASVNLLPTQINGKTYILNLLSDNGHRRFEKRVYKNFKNLVIEPQQYYLAEGSHTLTIEQWYSEDYRGTLNNTYDAYNTKKIPNIYFTRNKFATAIQTKVIQLNVKAGHKYSLNLSSNNLDAQVHVETETKLTCVADSSEILNAKEARMEIRKVVWPTRKETVQTSLIVIAATIFMTLVVWGVDSVYMLIHQMIL